MKGMEGGKWVQGGKGREGKERQDEEDVLLRGSSKW